MSKISKVRVVGAEFSAAASELSQLPPPAMLEIAFAGRSNVGKSTLLSALSGQKSLARISKDPGRTRALVFFDARLRVLREGQTQEEEARLGLVDLPGYGYAKISKKASAAWQPLIEGYLQSRPTLRQVLILVDARRGPEQEERDLIEFLRQPPAVERNEPVTATVVVTKLDKLSRHERKPVLAAFGKELGAPVFGVSGETGEGVDELWKRVAIRCFG